MGVLLVQIQFPFAIKDRKKIEKHLHSVACFDFDMEIKEWIWLDCEKDKIDKNIGTTLLGSLFISDNYLVATVNSIERAERIKELLTTLLGEMIGSPLSVHDNPQHLMEDPSLTNAQQADPLADPELINTFLNQHYRKILDEPIPALKSRSPRDCARDKKQHAMLIQWLKGLENTTASSPMAGYDFTWMWEELGLKRI